MPHSATPIDAICQKALEYPDVMEGSSCNQMSYSIGKKKFLFIGPGAKGVGFKAMFKLEQSISQARDLAVENANRFEVGKTGWVTARFTEEDPLPAEIWEPWLDESYELSLPVKKRAKAG